jgi:hypothetical protein
VDSTSIYWGDDIGVMKAPLSGLPNGEQATTLSQDPGGSAKLLVGSDGVYWLSDYTQILRAPLNGVADGESPSILFSAQTEQYVQDFALDENSLYVSYSLSGEGRVAMRPRDPNSPVGLHVIWQGIVRGIAVTADALYLATESGVVKVSPKPQ